MFGLLLSSCTRDKSFAQTTAKAESRKAFVVFADHDLRENEWSALLDALRSSFEKEGGNLSAAEFLRGDRVVSGNGLSEPIVIYLHGNCSLVPVIRASEAGTLGWVRRVHGHIEPFIHVDCTQIGLELGPVSMGMNRNRRDTVMSEAMARVILHEWIHIATQNPGHDRRGVAKAHFDVADLLANDEEMRRNSSLLRPRWNHL
jgi:hypothetical protein